MAITPLVDTIVVGDSAKLSYDVNGGRAVSVQWQSGDTTLAVVNDSGSVRARAIGTTRIVLVAKGAISLSEASDTATVVLVARPSTSSPAPTDSSKSSTAATASVQVTPTGVRLTPGQTAPLSAKALDANGAVIAGRATAWTTSNAAIATVDSTGLARAIAIGTATVTATIDGKTATSDITVAAPTVATVSVGLNSSAVTVGQTTQALATAKDASGTAVTGRTVTWTTSNPGVATVSSSGLVAAISAGTAAITASVDGITGNASITVANVTSTPTSTPPTTSVPAGAIAMSVVRMDGGSGPALVSNGIPLAPGTLYPGQTGSVRVFVGGQEQSVYAEDLGARHSDGSLSAVLVQFNVPSLSTGAPLAGSLVLGQARGTPDLPKPSASRGTPAAAALPTDPAYLLATKLVGPAVSVAAAQAMGGAFAKYEQDFVTYADQHWASEGTDWASGDYYDRAEIYYKAWARSGNPEYWRRATLMAVAYRDGYLLASSTVSSNGPSAHWSLVEGVAEHYLMTGDTRSRMGVGFAASALAPLMTFGQPAMNYEWDPRIRGRTLQALELAWRIGAPWVEMPSLAESPIDWRPRLDDALAKVASTVNADGTVRQPVPADWGCPAQIQSNFMVAVQNDALIRVYEEYRHDASVLPAVKRSIDYMWATQWRAADEGFAYMSGQCSTSTESQTYTAPDLNNLFSGAFGWVYSQTGDATYRSRGDVVFATGVAHAYVWGGKQFNEAYTNSARYMSDRH